MMIAGTLVGGGAACVGFAYGWWCNRTMSAELMASAEFLQTQSIGLPPPSTATPASPAPELPIGLAILPLAIPILGIGGVEIGRSLNLIPPNAQISSPIWSGTVELLANPGFVLMISAAISVGLLRRIISAGQSQPFIVKAIADAGSILLLTCAGGAFGTALKHLQLADALATSSQTIIAPHTLLLGAFLLTALIRIAQGSATVAMITAVGIVSPFVQGESSLPYNSVYLALAIGCGAKMLPWMNDSGFWQVSSMSGMTVGQTLKTFSAALSIMGVVGFVLTLIGAWLLPLK